MVPAGLPANERQRLDALHSFEILDTQAEEAFDRFTRIAARMIGVPIALVSLVDEARQWFKSHHGIAATETPRDWAFCAYAIQDDKILVVDDASKDPRFADNPLVTGVPDIRFYAGAPLRTRDNFNIGTLCVIDPQPRRGLTPDQQELLADLADAVVNQLYLHKTTADLQKSQLAQAQLGAIIEYCGDAVIGYSIDGTIISWNSGAQGLYGHAADQAVGESCGLLVPHALLDEWRGMVERISRGEAIEQFETVRLACDGRPIDVSISLSPIRDKTGVLTGFSTIARDISQRKQIEKAKAEFVSTVSHELRTPLTSIKGSLGLVQSGVFGELPEAFKPMVEIAYNNSDRLVRLINDLLDIEKMEAGKMDFHLAPVEMAALLRQSVRENDGYAVTHNVRFAVVEPLPQVIVAGDKDRLLQVMANLLSNAAKFSPPEGVIEVALEHRPGAVRVSVTDQGPGIPDNFQKRIFQKFSQADSSDSGQKGGTGLGLSICRAIVERHGGAIDFKTERGVGTTFYFDLPEDKA
jgi:PAS domain S-box-containing protein